MANDVTTGRDSEPDHLEGLKEGTLSPTVAGGLALAAFVPGVGIATMPAFISGQTGNLAWLAVLVGMVAVLSIAVSVVVFSRRFVVSGALYSYVNRIFGRVPSTITAVSILFAYILGIALLVVAGALYLGTFLAAVGVSWGPSPLAFTVFAILISVIGGVVTYFGVDVSAKLSITLFLITVPLVLLITVMLPFTVNLDVGSQFDFANIDFSGPGFLGGVILAIAVMILFESSTATAVETRNPKRSLPIIVAGVPIVLGVLYSVSSIIQVPALGLVADELATGISPITALAGLVGLGGLGAVIDLSLAIAAISGAIAFLNYGSHVLATMANDGVLPRGLARVHTKHGNPDRATLAVSILVFAFVVLMLIVNGGDTYAVYNFNSAIYILFVVIPYILVSVGAVVLLRRERAKSWPFLVLTTIVGSAPLIWILISAFIAPAPGFEAIAYIWLAIMVIVVGALLIRDRATAKRVTTP